MRCVMRARPDSAWSTPSPAPAGARSAARSMYARSIQGAARQNAGSQSLRTTQTAGVRHRSAAAANFAWRARSRSHRLSRQHPTPRGLASPASWRLSHGSRPTIRVHRGIRMSIWEEKVNRHAAELVRLTMKAADQGPDPLPEDEVAQLGKVIAIERQLLIDAMSGLLFHDEPEAAESPGVAEFD